MPELPCAVDGLTGYTNSYLRKRNSKLADCSEALCTHRGELAVTSEQWTGKSRTASQFVLLNEPVAWRLQTQREAMRGSTKPAEFRCWSGTHVGLLCQSFGDRSIIQWKYLTKCAVNHPKRTLSNKTPETFFLTRSATVTACAPSILQQSPKT